MYIARYAYAIMALTFVSDQGIFCTRLSLKEEVQFNANLIFENHRCTLRSGLIEIRINE